MASSNQCGNCGQVGHFRSRCPLPKNESLEHWHAAKAQFRRENPDEVRKLYEKKEENWRWKQEGKSVPFSILNEAVGHMLQILYDLGKGLDVLGRPKEWEEVNKKLDTYLPLIRELVNNGKGFQMYGRLQELVVDADIFVSRLNDLPEIRDQLVHKVKSFVNGKLGKLARENARNDPEQLLRYVYQHHPPKRTFTFDETMLNGSTLKGFIKKALLHYHPDKQVEYDADWQCLCEEISRCLTASLRRLPKGRPFFPQLSFRN